MISLVCRFVKGFGKKVRRRPLRHSTVGCIDIEKCVIVFGVLLCYNRHRSGSENNEEVYARTLGERIKELRKKNDLTQEKLADFLCVSCQAVSKWECGLSSPDLSLIVPLSKLLHVTTDELLGAAPAEADSRYAQLQKDYDATFRTGDLDERLRITETAVREYPGDMKWLNNYAWDIWCAAVVEPDEELFRQQRERVIKMLDTVIQNTEDDRLKAHAIEGIVQCLCGKGQKAEARRYVELFPEARIAPERKEKLLNSCLEGEEQLRHKQKTLERTLETLVMALLWENVGSREETCRAAEEILRIMIPDGNYCHHHHSLCHVKFRQAELAIKAGEVEKAENLLRQSVFHAGKYDLIDTVSPGEYTFTAPLFDGLTYDSSKWCRTGDGKLVDDIRQMFRKRKHFAPLWEKEKEIFG